jgi:hypothetical protein
MDGWMDGRSLRLLFYRLPFILALCYFLPLCLFLTASALRLL